METIQLDKFELLNINGGYAKPNGPAHGIIKFGMKFWCGFAEGWSDFWNQDLKIR
jgi:hypothetical protein